MSTTPQTLAAWLLEQITADEQVARAAGEAPWVSMETAPWVHVDPAAIRENKWKFGDQGHVATADSGGHARHIATHDPARVLRQCAALRAVVADHEAYSSWDDDLDEEDGRLSNCGICGPDEDGREGCQTVRTLATIYADRPGADAFLGES